MIQQKSCCIWSPHSIMSTDNIRLYSLCNKGIYCRRHHYVTSWRFAHPIAPAHAVYQITHDKGGSDVSELVESHVIYGWSQILLKMVLKQSQVNHVIMSRSMNLLIRLRLNVYIACGDQWTVSMAGAGQTLMCLWSVVTSNTAANTYSPSHPLILYYLVHWLSCGYINLWYAYFTVLVLVWICDELVEYWCAFYFYFFSNLWIVQATEFWSIL